MNSQVKDRSGVKYNNLTAISFHGVVNKRAMWNCECDCGASALVSGGDLHSGKQKSCRDCGRKSQAGKVRKTNSYTVSGDVAIIDVSTKSSPNTMTVIDADDLGRVIDGTGRWGASIGRGGAVYVYKGRENSLHRLLNETPEGMITDHIDGDTLNNRKSNLRDATYQDNNRNASLRKDNKSGCPGVSFHKGSQKWMARIKIDGKDKHLGYFDGVNNAISARREANKKYGYHKNHGKLKCQ